MPSLSNLGALLGTALLLSTAIAAQTPPNSARVQQVVVRESGAAMEVEIQTSGSPVAPDTQAITGPDRIVVDFPGALPAAELRALKVNRGALKGVRSGLFFSNPPITRIVLDLTEPQTYQISTSQNAIVVKLGSAKAKLSPEDSETKGNAPPAPVTKRATLKTTALTTGAKVGRISTVADTTPRPAEPEAVAAPPKPSVTVTCENGMLRIRADKATLAQVLFEVQRQTHADIAIPAGAEQEQVAADLGPAPSRDVLASLLNGSSYNFIFVGNELSLERVILTRRDSSIF